MSVTMQRGLPSRVHEDADPQMELQPEDGRRVHGEYSTRPNLPSLRTLNPAPPTSGSFVTRGPYQETDWPDNSSGAVPEEAAAAAPEVVISAGEQRCAPDAAAGANVVDPSATPLMKGPPLRTMTSAPSLSSLNPKPTGPLSRSVSALSHRSQCGESTMHQTENLAAFPKMSNQEPLYEEVKGINNKLFRVYYKDIEISEDLIPVQYKDQYDIALLYADDDLDEAMGLRTLIERFGITDTGERPRVCTVDNNPDMMEGSKIKHVEDAMRISTYVFLFLTKKFCEDRWAALQKDECLMASLKDPDKRWCIVPVMTQKRGEQDITKAYSIPFGLQSLKPIDISRITLGENLADLTRDDPEDGYGIILTEREIKRRDRFFLNFFNSMLSRKLPIRKAREQQVAMAREMYIKELKRQKAREKVRRLAEEDARRFREQKNNEIFEQQLQKRVETGDIAESPLSTISSGPRGPSHGGVAASVESGPSYHYHFYNAEGAKIPAMPPGKQTTVHVSSGNIVQVGDCNTATALNADEEGDIYVPDNDVPLRRHVTNGNAPRVTQTSAAADTAGKQTQGRYSDSDSEDDLYQSQISNKEALFCQEEYARQPMMEQAKSIGLEFDEIESTQAEEEASLQLKHLSNPGSVLLKDLEGTNHDQEKSGFSQFSISSTGVKNVGRESSSSRASASNSVEIPNASHRTTHRRTAKGSPTEDDSGNNLPKLYVSELNNSYPGRNTGDIDTSEDPHKNESSHTEDPPSISERIVIGQEHDSVTLGTNSGPANSVVSSQPGAGSNNDSQKLRVTEKKEAQSKFDQNHSDEPADSNVNSNPDTMDLSGCNDVPEMPETLITENFVASFSEVDTQSIKSQTVVQGGVPPAPYMASLYDREPSMNSEKSESSLASLFDYVNQQKRELWPTTPSVESASRSISESGAIPSTEIAGCLNSVDEFTAFVEGENRDMERPRPIQQIQLNAFTEMDGVELPSGLWSICYAYPHHIDSSYPLGRSILTSIKAEEYRHQEDDEDLD